MRSLKSLVDMCPLSRHLYSPSAEHTSIWFSFEAATMMSRGSTGQSRVQLEASRPRRPEAQTKMMSHAAPGPRTRSQENPLLSSAGILPLTRKASPRTPSSDSALCFSLKP